MLSRFSLLLLFMLSAAAQSSADSLQVVINKGEAGDRVVDFKDFSRIDFKDGSLVFDTPDLLTVPLSEVATIHFEEGYLGQRELDLPGAKVCISKDALSLEGCKPEITVDIYSVSGAKALSVPNYSGGKIDISGLDKGIYIVKAGDDVFKVVFN